jgi:hypothetical protein
MGGHDNMMAMQDMEGVEQRQEEAPSTFQRIEELESHGINKQDIQKLKSAGYHTIESVSLGNIFTKFSPYLVPGGSLNPAEADRCERDLRTKSTKIKRVN